MKGCAAAAEALTWTQLKNVDDDLTGPLLPLKQYVPYYQPNFDATKVAILGVPGHACQDSIAKNPTPGQPTAVGYCTIASTSTRIGPNITLGPCVGDANNNGACIVLDYKNTQSTWCPAGCTPADHYIPQGQ